jgi:hypothetical protein
MRGGLQRGRRGGRRGDCPGKSALAKIGRLDDVVAEPRGPVPVVSFAFRAFTSNDHRVTPRALKFSSVLM